jgi:exodeoxyribonuclease VII large subunit
VGRPARVQGRGAADDIAQAIKDLNRYKKIDVMIVGRGGGSLEDLWAFNEEVVARAIYHSEIPVISAVGHEIDFTISDFVADLRAPTPSAAAQMVVEDQKELLEQVRATARKLSGMFSSMLELSKQRLTGVRESYGFRRPLDIIIQRSQKVDEADRQLAGATERLLEMKAKSISLLGEKLNALSPVSVMKRGYSVTRRLPNLKPVTDAAMLKEKDKIEVKFFKGKIESQVECIDLN